MSPAALQSEGLDSVGSVRSSTFSKIRRSIEGLFPVFFYKFNLPEEVRVQQTHLRWERRMPPAVPPPLDCGFSTVEDSSIDRWKQAVLKAATFGGW